MDFQMTLILCAECGMPFALTKDFSDRLHNCHNTFYCPKGHPQSFPQESEADRLRKQLRTEQQKVAEYEEKARRELANRRRAAKKAQETKKAKNAR